MYMDEHNEKIGGVGKVVALRSNSENGSITVGEDRRCGTWIRQILYANCSLP